MGAPVGNQNAVKENRRWKNTLDRAIAQDNGERLRNAAEKLLSAASNGEAWAIKELGDRLDGKPAQAIEHSGPDGSDIPHRVEVVLVGTARA